MDILALFFGLIAVIVSGLYLVTEHEYFGENKTVRNWMIVGLMLIGWMIFAHANMKPETIQRPVIEMTSDGVTKQYVLYNGREVNINQHIKGYVPHDSTIIIELRKEVWSWGLFCVIGEDAYKVLRVEEPPLTFH